MNDCAVLTRLRVCWITEYGVLGTADMPSRYLIDSHGVDQRVAARLLVRFPSRSLAQSSITVV